MVHGLMTASIGTKIGGDLNYIAREMVSEFLRPVLREIQLPVNAQ